MPIPSYDDLTPSIPDSLPGELLASAAAVVPAGGGPVVRVSSRTAASGDPSVRFAVLDGLPVERLVAIGRDFSPRLERLGGGVALDVAGLQRLLGDAPAIGDALARAGAPRVAMAATYTAARLLARARPGVTIATGDPEAAVRDVPLHVLQDVVAADAHAPNGVPMYRPRARQTPPAGETPLARAFDVLERWGLTTLGELAALPADGVAARLGVHGHLLQRLARGLDARPLVPARDIPRFTATFELDWPVDTLEPLSFVFARLLDPLTARLERADRGAVALHLTLRLTDRSTHARSLALPVAIRETRVLRTLLLLDLESHPPPAAVDVVALELDPAPSRIVQYSLLDRALPSPETLATLMARLTALVGEGRCGSPVLLETHRPDAWEMGPCTVDAQLPPASAGTAASRPDPVLRRFRPPVAIRVAVDRGRPVRVAIDRRGMPGGVVTQSAGPWRTSGAWWTPGRWDRDEWDVAFEDGAVCRLFRDRDGGGWFLEGIYD